MATPALFTELKMGDLTLKNRIAMAPLTRGRAVGETDWVASGDMAEYYSQRAAAGLIVSEATSISLQGEGWYRAPRIFTKKHSDAWRQVTDAVHSKGGVMFCQLWHTGRASHSSFRPDMADGRGVAPSPIMAGGGHKFAYTPIGRVDNEVPRELSTEEVDALPADYVNAAKCAKEAGFDGVEIHSANGYLLDMFLQAKTNTRTDKYGGSIEKRTKLLLDVVKAVCEVFPSNRVAVRISPNGVFNDMGTAEYRELFTYVATKLNEFNLAYLHIMNGLAFGFHKLGTPMELPEFRAVYKGAIMANCGYTKEMAASDVRKGDCELVAFGRPYISNPDLVHRFENNIQLAPSPSDHLYSEAGENLGKKGYTDYPLASAPSSVETNA